MVVYYQLQLIAMPFRKNNEYCSKPLGERALDQNPLCIKIDPELKARLKKVPDWQYRLRDALPRLIDQWNDEDSNSSSTAKPQ